MEQIEDKFRENLVALRKSKGLTQSQLAEELNYSDKTISKWENGDALPDTKTLHSLSRFFNVTMDCLFAGEVVVQDDQQKKKTKQNNRNKLVITLLSVLVVWFVAVFSYVSVKIFADVNLWILYVWAVPASCIVLLVFNSVWGKNKLNYLIITFLVWSLIISVHLQVLMAHTNIWPIYFVGVPVQIAIILWAQIKK